MSIADMRSSKLIFLDLPTNYVVYAYNITVLKSKHKLMDMCNFM